ncbi:universal stress protein [Sphaerisporangium sp. TRM90804]|uniref:universal stress protein n=1 Tax=Sphaerisporangium sp. TRM90804 TaxID=3031113 RepID=UPI0024480089|nr:universal stress protein [Sphaerisporangium sp. TRM90804]MDH2425465.1 universal stress protein [Sphaerisporangium sp. TRM90804]
MNGHVVVAVDGSAPATDAVRWAADDAARRGLPLRIVHVTEPWTGEQALITPPGLSPPSPGEGARAVLSEAARAARERVPGGLPVETAALTGQVRAVLLEEARSAVELVVGTRGLGGFMGLVLGSVSMGVAGHTDCPVVVAGHVGTAPRGEIVVGHDGMADSEAALEYAFADAGRRGSRLRTIYAWQVSAFLPTFSSYTADMDAAIDWGRHAAEEQLVPWRTRYPRVEVRDLIVSGDPVEALSEASADADLVVVGSRGRGAIGSAMLGSVSHGLLHHAHCPVAVVRAREWASRPQPGEAGRDEAPGGPGLDDRWGEGSGSLGR